jgi:hypothetical protein
MLAVLARETENGLTLQCSPYLRGKRKTEWERNVWLLGNYLRPGSAQLGHSVT